MKKHIALLCGGRSAEHEVSLESAKNILTYLDPLLYRISVVYMTKAGEWFLLDTPDRLFKNPPMTSIDLSGFPAEPVVIKLGATPPFWVQHTHALSPLAIDLVFPIAHGVLAEDGTLQGLLELSRIPYIGSKTLGSAICMDKSISKQLLHNAGMRVAPWLTISKSHIHEWSFENVVYRLSQIGRRMDFKNPYWEAQTLFVKPANTGSSIGISKVMRSGDFRAVFKEAVDLALSYDDKLVFETYIPGREIECAVLQKGDLISASLPGEIIPHDSFYTYQAKYINPEGASLKTPAELSPRLIEKIQSMARQAFETVCCADMARVDFFLTPDQELVVNEINTLPGFTTISQYPNMWRVSGVPYETLITCLVNNNI